MEIYPTNDPTQQEIEQLNRTIMMGRVMEHALTVKDSALNILLQRAEADAIEAGQQMLTANLTTDQGRMEALAWQARYTQFIQLIEWIYEIGADAQEAEDSLEDMQAEDADAEYRRELDGKPEQPAD